MNVPKIERSRVDARWCVYSKYYECLCSWLLIPVAVIKAMFASPPKDTDVVSCKKGNEHN